MSFVHRKSVAYKFGLVAMAAGLIGVPAGSFMAQRMRSNYPSIDPVICAFGLLISAPFVYLALLTSKYSFAWSLTFVFLGEVFVNLTWSLVADVILVRWSR